MNIDSTIIDHFDNETLCLPVKSPGRVTSRYGWRILNGRREWHDGLDYVSETGSNTVYAIGDSVATYDYDAYVEAERWTNRKMSGGNMIILRTRIEGAVYYVRYLHLINNYVHEGELVNKGRVIGHYGNVGYSFGAHLHIDIYKENWTKIDITPFFGKYLDRKYETDLY